MLEYCKWYQTELMSDIFHPTFDIHTKSLMLYKLPVWQVIEYQCIFSQI